MLKMPEIEASTLLKASIAKGVGNKKKNMALDVALVQSLLNAVKSRSEEKKIPYRKTLN